MTSTNLCPKCGSALRPPTAIDRLLFRPEQHVSLDDDLYVTCGQCGHKMPQKVLGILSPKAVKTFAYLFLAAFLAAIALGVWWGR